MKNKSRDFKFLQDKLEARLNGWRSKCLSWAGRCTLIKSVAQALPTYTMSSFEVTKKVCDALDSQSRRFWWNPKKQNGSYLAWKFWDHLCQPKGKGGLGFRYAKGIFSTKSAYRIIQDHVKGNNPSVQWQNLWKMKI